MEEIEILSSRAIQLYDSEDYAAARPLLIKVYNLVKKDPTLLKALADTSVVGHAYLLMLDAKISTDIDTLQIISSVGYLLLSVDIINNPHNLNSVKNRLFLLSIGQEGFYFTAKYSMFNDVGIMEQMDIMFNKKVKDSIYMMEIADYEKHAIISQQIEYLSKRRQELNTMIEKNSFRPITSKELIVEQGLKNHRAVLDYLETKIFFENSLDF